MTAFLTAIALLAIALAAHVAIWRIRPPRNRLRGLITIFAVS